MGELSLIHIFTLEGHHPVPYEGRRGIRALLEGMELLLGWQPIMEGPNIIGLFDVTGGGAISLEPGGQFELSGAQVETVHQTSSELMAHLAQVREVAQPLHIGFLGMGMTPSWTLAEMPKMPKGRYKIMTAYMPKVGDVYKRQTTNCSKPTLTISKAESVCAIRLPSANSLTSTV